MTATFAPSPWPAPAPVPQQGPWRFGREVIVAGRPAMQWVHKRNCSLAPRQLITFYLSLCVLSLGIAAAFWFHGATLIIAFTGVELLLVGVALACYARHAADREVLTLSGRDLAVEQHVGPRVESLHFPAEWLAVEPAAGQGSLIELSARGQRVRVGRFVRPELRAAFAQELRRALRRAAR